MNGERAPNDQYDADLARPNPLTPKEVLYWCSGIVLILLALWYVVAVTAFPHTIIDLNAKQHREILDGFITEFEKTYPNPKKSLRSLIPSGWAPNAARYSFYFGQICREIEGRERVCDKAEGQLITSGLLGQFGLLIGGAEPDPAVAQEWVKASNMMLSGALRALKSTWVCKWKQSIDTTKKCSDRAELMFWRYNSSVFLSIFMIFRCLLVGFNSIFNFFFCFEVTRKEAAPFAFSSGIVNCLLNSILSMVELIQYDGSALFEGHPNVIRHGTYSRALFSYSIWAWFFPMIIFLFSDTWSRSDR